MILHHRFFTRGGLGTIRARCQISPPPFFRVFLLTIAKTLRKTLKSRGERQNLAANADFLRRTAFSRSERQIPTADGDFP